MYLWFPRDLVKMQIPIQQVRAGAWDYALLVSSQEMPPLLVHEPHSGLSMSQILVVFPSERGSWSHLPKSPAITYYQHGSSRRFICHIKGPFTFQKHFQWPMSDDPPSPPGPFTQSVFDTTAGAPEGQSAHQMMESGKKASQLSSILIFFVWTF